MEYMSIEGKFRNAAAAFLEDRWGTAEMIIRGEVIDLTKAQGFMAIDGGKTVGLITYYIKNKVCEITSLDSNMEGRGIGSKLVKMAVEAAKENGCEKIVVETTNDNIKALRFYQKRGFDMVRLRRNSLDTARKIRPSIPLYGKEGIPLKHNIEFEIVFK